MIFLVQISDAQGNFAIGFTYSEQADKTTKRPYSTQVQWSEETGIFLSIHLSPLMQRPRLTRSGGRQSREEHHFKLVSNGRSERAQAAAEKHMFEPMPKIWLP